MNIFVRHHNVSKPSYAVIQILEMRGNDKMWIFLKFAWDFVDIPRNYGICNKKHSYYLTTRYVLCVSVFSLSREKKYSKTNKKA